MYKRISNFLKTLSGEESGITGLETAIILIAFVTVASVLAYSVLSAGIYSAERGKETVYRGLESAQSTLEIKGSVLGLSVNKTVLDSIQFNIGVKIPIEVVDVDTIVYNYYDDSVHVEGLTANVSLSAGSNERGSMGMIEGDEIHVVLITLPGSANITGYKTFTIQMVPPTGATITLKRTLPRTLLNVIDLK